MELNEYQREALKTLHADADYVYLAGKLMCEAAEVAEPLFKARYHGKPLDMVDVAKELGDVLWYVATLADALGLELDAVAGMNLRKLRQRHGETYNGGFYTSEGRGARGEEAAAFSFSAGSGSE